MSEFRVESDAVDVEKIMEQIRDRIKEKRDIDYTEEQIREMASVKLERFLDPDKVRSDLVEHYRQQSKDRQSKLAFPDKLKEPPPAPESYDFDHESIYRSGRDGIIGTVLYRIRKILSPLLKFYINFGPIIHALQVQREINERQNEAINWMVQTQAEFIDRVTKLFDLSSSRLAAREEIDALNYEVMNNLVVEMTRLSIEMRNHRMRVESVAGRLEFSERRARALEEAVQYRDDPQKQGSNKSQSSSSDGSEQKRRRRRRSRRRPPSRTDAASIENSPSTELNDDTRSTPDAAESSQTTENMEAAASPLESSTSESATKSTEGTQERKESEVSTTSEHASSDTDSSKQ